MSESKLPKRLAAERDRMADDHYRRFRESNAFRNPEAEREMNSWIESHENSYKIGFTDACETLAREVIGPMREALEKIIKHQEAIAPAHELTAAWNIADNILDKTQEWCEKP